MVAGRAIVLAAALGAGLPSGVCGAETQALKLDGLYAFRTTAQENGSPVCSETWSFDPDGTVTVESGQEVVRKRFRTEHDRDGHWIVSEGLETNGQPDCMGERTPVAPEGERRTYVVPMNDGSIELCPAPTRAANGAPYISGCYGRIVHTGATGSAESSQR